MGSSRVSDGAATGAMRRFRIAGMPLPAVGFLFLSAVIALLRSHYRLLEGDEFGFGLLDFDKSASLSRLIHMELTTPISFDPIGYNVLIQALIHLFGASAFVLRLPSILGYLTMQVCLFYFVRRIAGERAGTVALAIPTAAGIVEYAILSRPYGLLLGLSGLAMVSWQTAVRSEERRGAALAVLALSLAAAVNVQYYAVLLFVPLCGAELVRLRQRRRLDVPMLMAIVAGMAGILVAVPFARALSPFRSNHGDETRSIHFITHAYLWLLVGYARLTLTQQHVIGASAVMVLLALIASFIWLRSRAAIQLPSAEMTFLLLLAGFPVLAYLLAIFVTHFVEARYIQPALIGLAAIVSILCAPLLLNRTVERVVLAGLLLAIVGSATLAIRMERARSRGMMAALVVTPATLRTLRMSQGEPIYVMKGSDYLFIRYYSPDPEVRSRMALVYLSADHFPGGVGADVEMQMANMRLDGIPNVAEYSAVSGHATEHLFLVNSDPGDWPVRELAQSKAEIKPLGTIFGQELAEIRFP
jgi:hypothetical protein